MAILSQLTAVLSEGLNRAVGDGLLRAAVSLYRESGSKDQFAASTLALGFSPELSRLVFVFINDNIAALDGEVEAAPQRRDAAKSDPLSDRGGRKPRPKPAKRAQVALDWDLDDDDGRGAGQRAAEPPKKITFKKIRKEDAQRLKQTGPSAAPEPEDAPAAAAAPKPAETLLKQAPAAEAQVLAVQPLSADAEPLEPTFFDDTEPDAVENDREWYTLEDTTTAAVETYEMDEAPRPAPVRRENRSGGGFTAQGEYVDYDHEAGGGRIPIVAHFSVPPFLRGEEHHLTLQLGGGRALGPSVDPVKDAESELAVAARTGSFAVRQLKEKTERAKHLKSRVGEKEAEEDGEEKEEKGGEKKEGKEKNEGKDEGKAGGSRGDGGNASSKPPAFPTYSREEIRRQRESLPAYTVRSQLVRTIAENQIVVVIGETGSGKTTQLAQFLAEEGYTAGHMIGCTQPRRVAAMSVAKRVADEMGVAVGADVGYTIRFEDRTSGATRIKYMTEGILLREMLELPHLDQYSVVIMDEAHERSLNTDVLLGLFRQLLRRRRDLKLVVTSATMNADRFLRFFGGAPQFSIPGRTFPVDIFHAKTRCADYVETAVKQVVTIHLAQGEGDILVFMTGQEDIEATCTLIGEKLQLLENPPPLDVFPIYSTLPADTQQKIFSHTAGRRKCVVATNIAETSLTVAGVRFVVDCGLAKMKLFNAKLGMDALQTVPIAYANAQQRSGRAGRTGPGIAYRIYTEAAALPAQMYVQPVPEIQRANLALVMLLLKSLRVQNVGLFPFLDAPPPDLLACSLYDLWALGALDHRGALTPLGAQMSAFPMEPTLAKLVLLLSRPEFACSSEILTIVAMLSVPPVFHRPRERAADADAMRERFLVASSDHLSLLNVYTQFEQRHKSFPARIGAWCAQHFLHLRSLVRARDVRRQLVAIMAKQKFPVVKAASDDAVRRCICAAYFHQLAVLRRMRGKAGAEYANLRQPYMQMVLHPTLALAAGRDLSPNYVVYDELVLTKREYMQCVTAVEPEWLLEFGGVFFGSEAKKEVLEDVEVEAAEKAAPKPKFRKINRGF